MSITLQDRRLTLLSDVTAMIVDWE
jgi:hypothetical protein